MVTSNCKLRDLHGPVNETTKRIRKRLKSLVLATECRREVADEEGGCVLSSLLESLTVTPSILRAGHILLVLLWPTIRLSSF